MIISSLGNNNFRLDPGSPEIDAGNPDRNHNGVDDLKNNVGAYGGKYGNW